MYGGVLAPTYPQAHLWWLMSGGADWGAAWSLRGATPAASVPQYAAVDYHAGLERAAAICRRSHASDGQDERRMWQTRFCTYLRRLPTMCGWPQPTMHTATPAEVLAFCTMEVVPHHGRTPLADGQTVPSASYMRGVLAHLRTGFCFLGREGEWDHHTLRGNPCDNIEVRQYRSGYENMLWVDGVEPTAASPLTEEKVHRLVDGVDAMIGELSATSGGSTLPPQPDRFLAMRLLLLERDAAMYLYLWESHQRGSEGGRLRPCDLKQPGGAAWPTAPLAVPRYDYPVEVHPNGTKSRRRRACGSFVIDVGHPCPRYDLLTRLNRFIAMCAEDGQYAGDTSPIFRTRDYKHHDRFSATAVESGVVTNRMRQNLAHTDEYAGETSHSFRRGGMQARQATGETASVTMSRALMSSDKTYKRYTDRTCAVRGVKKARPDAPATRSRPEAPATGPPTI